MQPCCAVCTHITPERVDNGWPRIDGVHRVAYCNRFKTWQRIDEPTDCAEFDQAKVCGACVVYNGDEQMGYCTRMGHRAAREAGCRAFFPKDELNKPLYGKEPKT